VTVIAIAWSVVRDKASVKRIVIGYTPTLIAAFICNWFAPDNTKRLEASVKIDKVYGALIVPVTTRIEKVDRID